MEGAADEAETALLVEAAGGLWHPVRATKPPAIKARQWIVLIFIIFTGQFAGAD